MHISNSIHYIGVADHDIDLFEGQYPVPYGVTYNSYVIMDEKIAVMDTVDSSKEAEWLKNLSSLLQERTPDYLIISHLEPDHSGSIQALADLYPQMQLVMSDRALAMLPQFVDASLTKRAAAMKEGAVLSLGAHRLHFLMAPMVHWPEVMVAYEETEKILFSADAFGTFGMEKAPQAWLPDARRYFLNIVGKYGAPVQTLLKKAAALDIQKICPLHGPVLDENLDFYLDKYQLWSTYAPEEKGVLVAYGSLHGNTASAAKKLAEMLKAAGEENVIVADVARDDMAGILADAFRFDRMVLASATYDGNFFPKMEDFLLHLKAKSYQKRTVALIENGSWAPQAIKRMTAYLEAMPNITILPTTLSIKTKLKPEQEKILSAMVQELRA